MFTSIWKIFGEHSICYPTQKDKIKKYKYNKIYDIRERKIINVREMFKILVIHIYHYSINFVIKVYSIWLWEIEKVERKNCTRIRCATCKREIERKKYYGKII